MRNCSHISYVLLTVIAHPSCLGPGHPISEFLTSLDTSAGECKLMLTIEDELDCHQLLLSLQMPVMNL
jgi:hypothetical protein